MAASERVLSCKIMEISYRVPLRFIWQALDWALYYLFPLLGFTIRS